MPDTTDKTDTSAEDRPWRDDWLYADKQLIGEGGLAGTKKTLDSLEDNFGLPPGKWVGGTKRRSGLALNNWWSKLPDERRSAMAERFGPRPRGRPPRKPSQQATA
jgi:hypothetical protein